MEQAEPSKEKTELIGETKSLEDFPIEVLVKIFNFLPNHAIRCGVSLTCKRFQKICQDESLVPVKDLCIKGQKYRYWSGGKQICGLRNIGNVIDIIVQSKDLTTLKIKALNYESIYHLVSTALQVCPKLIHLEIVETFAQSIERDEDGGMAEDGYFKQIFESISTFGNGLCVINLKLYGKHWNFRGSSFDCIFDDYIAKGCPKLKSLTLESLDLSGDPSHFIEISESMGLESLSECCKELKNLKLTKICFVDAHVYPKSEVMKLFPNCNVDIKNCVKYKYCSVLDLLEIIPYEDYVLDNFEGGEIEFLFTENYGEE